MSDEMKRELNGLKTRMGHVETRLGHVESQLGDIKSDLRELKGMIAPLMPAMKRVAAETAKNTFELAEFKAYAMENFVTRAEFHSAIDGFTTKLQDSRFDWAKQNHRLDEHDKRLSRLEGRRA